MADLLVDLPPQTAQNGASQDKAAAMAEQKLKEYLDALEAEAKRAKDRWVKPEDTQRDLKLYRGEVGPVEGESFFEANFIAAFINRLTGLLTENRPMLRVEERKAGLKQFCDALEQAADANWDEIRMQRQTYKMCHNAAITGAAGQYVGYDPAADEIYIEILRKEQVLLDPAIIEAGLIEQAEFLQIDRVRPLSEIRMRFPGRGHLVKPDATVTETQEQGKRRTLRSSIADLARPTAGSADALGRAHVKEIWLRDRQRDVDGRPLFPGGRQIIRTREYILSDSPNRYWDGVPPIDWYDWGVDPEHPWGLSAPREMGKLQLSFNQIMDGLVENQLLTNFISLLMDYDALDPATVKKLQEIGTSMILRKKSRNSSVTLTVPPVFGADKINLARTLFTFAQLLTGVTDVTLGENPGSLQSGMAIEGLQEGASLMNRSRGSRLEDFYTSVGNKLVARVLQFWTADRMTALLGNTEIAKDYAHHRTDYFLARDGRPITDAERREAFRYVRFMIQPGSSMPGTRQNRAHLMMDLQKGRMAGRIDVLGAAGFPNPQEMIDRADKEAHLLAPPEPPSHQKKGP